MGSMGFFQLRRQAPGMKALSGLELVRCSAPGNRAAAPYFWRDTGLRHSRRHGRRVPRAGDFNHGISRGLACAVKTPACRKSSACAGGSAGLRFFVAVRDIVVFGDTGCDFVSWPRQAGMAANRAGLGSCLPGKWGIPAEIPAGPTEALCRIGRGRRRARAAVLVLKPRPPLPWHRFVLHRWPTA
jgi:hypothetical protein